nr:hypothetical protein [Tanacetum cinerariifolium]
MDGVQVQDVLKEYDPLNFNLYWRLLQNCDAIPLHVYTMPYTIARAICMHDYDMLPPSHGGSSGLQRFFHCAMFIYSFYLAVGTEEEQAKNFQWGLCRSTLNHLMCMPFTDVAQVANTARNYEIFHERDDDDTERPDKQ